MKEELQKYLAVLAEAIKLANRRGAFELQESVEVHKSLVGIAGGIDNLCKQCELLEKDSSEEIK